MSSFILLSAGFVTTGGWISPLLEFSITLTIISVVVRASVASYGTPIELGIIKLVCAVTIFVEIVECARSTGGGDNM